MFINNGCNVGIGTTDPNGKMTVVGNTFDIRNGVGGYGTGYALEFSTNATIPRIDFIDNGVYTGNIKSSGGVVTLQNSSNNALAFGTNNAERMRITSGGNAQYTGDPFIYSNTTSGGTAIHSGLRFHSTDKYIRFFTNDLGRMDITSGGNVEINTGSIKTGAPTNGTAQPWKLGNAVSGGVTTNHYIIVEINGTTYTINALQGLP